MAFPPAHMLIGAGLAELAATATDLPRYRAWGVAAVLAAAPDADVLVGILVGHGTKLHGTYSHSVSAAVIVALVGYAVGGWRWAAVAGTAYGSHLLVDLLDEAGRTNVMLAWPFSTREAVALAPVLPKVPFEIGKGPTGAATSLLRPIILRSLVLQTLLAAAAFAGMLAVAWAMRRGGRRAERGRAAGDDRRR